MVFRAMEITGTVGFTQDTEHIEPSTTLPEQVPVRLPLTTDAMAGQYTVRGGGERVVQRGNGMDFGAGTDKQH